MSDTTGPIGIFDSGFGGLTVARSVVDQMPNEDIVYLGDTARAPYGPLPISEAREYALECLDHLYEMGVKALVIACNTASAAVLRDARERYTRRYGIPVLEVIQPAVRRAVATTRDLGKTWYEHPSSRSALQEPVCMASLIHVDAKDNITGKDLLIFSNPNTTKGRNHITIKVSTDGGMTWPLSNQVTLDEDESWGYSCLSMIDKETVGIFYESSVAHMTFQAIRLTDLVK